jgi:hypothetical protein
MKLRCQIVLNIETHLPNYTASHSTRLLSRTYVMIVIFFLAWYVVFAARPCYVQQTTEDCACQPQWIYSLESFIYPTDVQLGCSKNVKIYMRGAATCSSFSQPSSGSYCMCFAKVININNQLKYIVYSAQCTIHTHTHTNKYWINMQPLEQTDSVNDIFYLIINTYNFSKAHTVAPWWLLWETETCSSTYHVNFNVNFNIFRAI